MNVTFITGNTNKAEFLSKHLGLDIGHRKVELDELQSLNLRVVTEHKVKQAFDVVKSPVLVEDIGFTIKALGGLPGPFIKWFIQEVGYEGLCRLADPDPERIATTSVCYAFFDGQTLKLFEGELHGSMPQNPRGDDGFGWNCVFIPKGQDKTNAEMSEAETERYSLRTTTVYPMLKEFLSSLDKQ